MAIHASPLHLAPDEVPSDPQPAKDPAKRLIVLVPGIASHTKTWESLRKRLEQEEGYRPDQTKWLLFDYGEQLAISKWLDKFNPGTRLLKPYRLDNLAHQLRARIDGEWAKNGGFDDVVLIGHSIGGLIARRVYLLAVNAVPKQRPSVWGHQVSRIVLFASPNRGNKLNWARWTRITSRLLHTIPFLPHLLYEDALRGSNFLTNLRIDWICHFRTDPDDILKNYQKRGKAIAGLKEFSLPRIVQFLGDHDKLVEHDDSKDIMGFSEEYYQRIADANHSNLYRLEPKFAPDPDARYALLWEAFSEKAPKNLYWSPPKKKDLESSRIKNVVFLLHGIRASNVDSWIAKLGSRLGKLKNTVVVRPEYGYFTALGFASSRARTKNIRFFQDAYSEQLAKHPDAKFHIIAHSNGTYMLGYSLKQTPNMQFKNVVLAGSALPESYEWASLMPAQVGQVMNERASRDWPIALLCRALASVGHKDVGPSGFAGFYGSSTSEVAYYNGGHDAALGPDNHNRLVNFIDGKTVRPPACLAGDPGYFRLLSNATPYLTWILLLMIFALIFWLSFQTGTFDPRPILVAGGLFVLIYIILDVI